MLVLGNKIFFVSVVVPLFFSLFFFVSRARVRLGLGSGAGSREAGPEWKIRLHNTDSTE